MALDQMLMEKHKHLVRVLDLVEVERFVDTCWRGPGRPQQNRRTLAGAYNAPPGNRLNLVN